MAGVRLLGVTTMLFAGMAHGGTVGNPGQALSETGAINLGLEYETVLSRDLDFDDGVRTTRSGNSVSRADLPGAGATIDGAEWDADGFFLKGRLGLLSRVEAYAKLGSGEADMVFTTTAADGGTERTAFQGEWDFAGAVGAKGCLLGCAPWFWGQLLLDVHYLVYEVDGEVTVNGEDLGARFRRQLIQEGADSATAESSGSTAVRQWQGTIYGHWLLGAWRPYLGLRYTHTDVEFNTTITGTEENVSYTVDSRRDFEDDRHVGPVVGVDYELNQALALSFEGRFVDGQEASAGVTWRF